MLELTEIEREPGYVWQTGLNGIHRIVITRRCNSERMCDTIGLLQELAAALTEIKQSEIVKIDGCIVPAWLVDYVTVDTYGGHAVAYLRPNT